MMRKLAVAVLGVVLMCLVLEAGFRLWYPQALYAIRYSPLGWSHVPGARFTHAGESREFVTRVAYNTHGLRDYEYPIEKPAGVQRVLLFGDSYGEALEVALEQTHAKLLEQRLNHGLPARRFEVLNFGVSAYDTAQEWQYLAREGVRYAPDLVIVLWTGERSSVFAKLVDGEPVFLAPQYTRRDHVVRGIKTALKSNSHLASFVIDRLRMNHSLDEFLWRVRLGPMQQAVKRTEDATMPPTAGQGSAAAPFVLPPGMHWQSPLHWELQLAIFRAMARVCHEHGARLLVAALYTRDYHELQPYLQGELADVVAISLQEDSDEEEQRRYHYPIDGHYNPAGHEKVARVLHDAILQQRLLQPVTGQSAP